MKDCIFITGTGTNIGKTLISSWIVAHTKYKYWKPIQTGCIDSKDTEVVRKLSNAENERIINSMYSFKLPLSPHIACKQDSITIDTEKIINTKPKNVIIEGVGGVMVPLNKEEMIIDLISKLKSPTIVVSRNYLGSINHTCLTLHALHLKKIDVLGVILLGTKNSETKNSIEKYGNTNVLMEFPEIFEISYKSLFSIKPSNAVTQIL